MRMGSGWSRACFERVRVAHLATVSTDGRPHLVPIVFAVSATGLVTAVDGKPKSTTALRRLANIAANPRVSVLVDGYAEDWNELWWARADGTAQVLAADAAAGALGLLADRYQQYRADVPGGPVISIDVEVWSGWSAGGVGPKAPN